MQRQYRRVAALGACGDATCRLRLLRAASRRGKRRGACTARRAEYPVSTPCGRRKRPRSLHGTA